MTEARARYVAAVILTDLEVTGGATVDSDGNAPDATSGYVVSLTGHERIIGRPEEAGLNEAVWRYVRDVWPIVSAAGWAELRARRRYVGAWTNDKGEVVLDVSEVIPTLAAAVRIGRERGQDAIWDIANGRELSLSAELFSVVGEVTS